MMQPPSCDRRFQLPAVPIQLQTPPERDPESPADEQPTLLAQPSVEFVTAAMSKLGSLNIFGQGMGSQGSMLPSESRKLAHLALRAQDVPEKVIDTYRPRGSWDVLLLFSNLLWQASCAA